MDPMLGDSTSLSTLPAATPGPVDPGAFAIFQPLYEAVLGGLGDVINNGTAVMIGYVHEFFVPMCTIALILMAINEVFSGGAYLHWLVKYVVRGSVVMAFVFAGIYAFSTARSTPPAPERAARLG